MFDVLPQIFAIGKIYSQKFLIERDSGSSKFGNMKMHTGLSLNHDAGSLLKTSRSTWLTLLNLLDSSIKILVFSGKRWHKTDFNVRRM